MDRWVGGWVGGWADDAKLKGIQRERGVTIVMIARNMK
jgi:hypothetical protein